MYLPFINYKLLILGIDFQLDMSICLIYKILVNLTKKNHSLMRTQVHLIRKSLVEPI